MVGWNNEFLMQVLAVQGASCVLALTGAHPTRYNQAVILASGMERTVLLS